MARVMAATSWGECVPTSASRLAGEAAVLTEVLTDDTEASGATDDDEAAAATAARSRARRDRDDGGGGSTTVSAPPAWDCAREAFTNEARRLRSCRVSGTAVGVSSSSDRLAKSSAPIPRSPSSPSSNSSSSSLSLRSKGDR